MTSCASALDPGDGAVWGLVVNCAGETRVGQTEAVYSEGIYTLSLNVARQCAKLKVDRLVEISSGQMHSSDKPQKEDCAVEPWTTEAKMKSKVEKELKNMSGELNYTIIRPAIVTPTPLRRYLQASKRNDEAPMDSRPEDEHSPHGHSVSGRGSKRQAPDGVGGAVQQVRAATHAAGAQRWTRTPAEQAALSRWEEAAGDTPARCTGAYY
ncbi:hypothetical protein HF086_018319 [Spodoptera exigua]|uniref:NAD(P)-binding domain-containing protein n=1 Tax=Spodoptera exigua TaxID=7107 RepID=A0A922M192_SPOEX|nr:hypothetical protein HF086_018319 [Spodoptera exigua]